MPDEKKAPAAPKTLSEANISTRDSLYDRAQAARDAAPKEGEPKKDAPTPADFKPAVPAEPGPKTEVPAATGDKGPAPTPPAVPEQKEPAAPGKEEKTVPLAALHEAREELKSLKRDNTELQDQVRTLLKDLKELSAKPQGDAPAAEEAPITDYDKELFALRKEVKELRERDEKRETLTEAERLKQSHAALKAQLQDTARDLEKDGFRGFEHLLPLVTAELQRLAATDKEAAQKLDNPDGWKKLFKEVVFPTVTGLSQKKSIEDKTREKEDLKNGASLLMPGSPPAPAKPEKEDDYSFDQYMKDRAKRSPQPQRVR